MSDPVKNSERLILVTGATGRQGGAVYQHLQKKGFKLRALVRDPDSNQARRLTWRERVSGKPRRSRQLDARDGWCVRRFFRAALLGK